MTSLTAYLIVTALLASALVAGIFYAFSTFVMRALARLPTAQGVAAMQSINVAVINPWFLIPFLGTGVVWLAIAWLAFAISAAEARTCAWIGCVAYVLGCVGVTLGRNVPMNDRLAAVDAQSAEGSEVWSRYLSRWTFWNHVRTLASLAAAALLTWVLLRGDAVAS